jgi:hypothetical protein
VEQEQTAGLAFGGVQEILQRHTEEYDGTSWTAGGNLNTARRTLAGCGIQTSALGFGGLITTAKQQLQKNMMEQLG